MVSHFDFMSLKDRSPRAFETLSNWIRHQNDTGPEKAAPTPFTMYHDWVNSHMVQAMSAFGAKKRNFETDWKAVCRTLETATGERSEPAKAKE